MLTNVKQIENIDIDFKLRTIEVTYQHPDGYTVLFRKKFALVSPYGLIFQGIRKSLFGEYVSENYQGE